MGCGGSKSSKVAADNESINVKDSHTNNPKDNINDQNNGQKQGNKSDNKSENNQTATQSPVDQKRKVNLIRPGQLEDSTEDNTTEKNTTKSEPQEERIWKAIQDSEVLGQFEMNQKTALCRNMYLRKFSQNTYLIKKDENLVHFVVVESGELEISDMNGNKSVMCQGDTYVSLFHPGPSKIQVMAKTDVEVWMINGKDFEAENYKTESGQVEKTISLLKEVPLLSNLTEEQLSSLVQMLQVVEYKDGEYIIKKGEQGTKFYIIKSGVAICYGGEEDIIGQKEGAAAGGGGNNNSNINNNNNNNNNNNANNNSAAQQAMEHIQQAFQAAPGRTEIRRLHDNDYFGEIALLHDIPRTIDVVSYGKTECWVLRREAFDQILGSLENVLNHNMKRRFIDSAAILAVLKPEEREQIVDSLEIEKFEDGDVIFHEGDIGDKFYIIQKGEVICYKTENEKEIELRHMFANDHFGERALMKEEPRSASIKAVGSVTVLSISRDAFIQHLGPMEDLLERKKMEDFVNSLNFFGAMKLPPVGQELLVEHSKAMVYKDKDIILNIGDQPSSFYIIEEGNVIVEDKNGDSIKLEKGSYFGEQAIVSAEPQKKRYISSGVVKCLVLPAKEFEEIIQPLLYKLEDMKVLGVLGLGGFALVKKVQPKGSNSVFALKAVSKTKLQTASSRQNVINEKNLMSQMNHPFLVKMITTFQDQFYVYMLQEFVEAGDLRTLMLHRRNGRFVENEAKFFSSVILLGLEHLHGKKIVYRDLKPENVLLCASGYVKIADFGNAKQIVDRTYSLCGTPDYMAPEVWLNKGHGIPCDIWAYGVLVYEFLNGETPFELTREGGQSEQIAKIIKGRVTYPLHFSPESTDFIRAILKVKPRQRLGCMKEGTGEIRQHKWLNNMDFNSLLKHQVKPPYVPSQSYIDRCCEAFNSLSEAEILAATVDQRGRENVWIDGF